MIFYKNRQQQQHRQSTMSLSSMKLANEERCAHFLALLAVVCVVVAGVMLYFAIVTQYSEQKTVYYIVFVVAVLATALFGGLTWFILNRIREKRECSYHYQMNAMAVRRGARMQQEELNEMRLSQSSLNKQQQKPQYYVNKNYQGDTKAKF